jgi:hypothetical protein
MEERIREKAVRAVSDIFRSAGFEVHHASPPVDLSAMSGNDYHLIVCSNDQDEIYRFSDTEFTVRDDGERACRKLVITFDSSIEAPDCDIWYAEDFIRYAGESVLSRVLGRELILRTAGSPWSGRESGATDRSDSISIPHLPVRIQREEAEERAKVPGVASLKFVPYWLYSFSSRGTASFKEMEVSFDSDGEGAMNAINGSVIAVDPDLISRRGIPGGSEILKAQIDKKTADERLSGLIIQKMTQKIKSRQVKGDAIYYEEKKVAPDRSNISLEIRELYIPVWQVKGKKIVEINAHTGEKLSEPMDDGVEVL